MTKPRRKDKCVAFENGRPVVKGEVYANAHVQAATLLGTNEIAMERVKGIGFCFVRIGDGLMRGKYNANNS